MYQGISLFFLKERKMISGLVCKSCHGCSFVAYPSYYPMQVDIGQWFLRKLDIPLSERAADGSFKPISPNFFTKKIAERFLAQRMPQRNQRSFLINCLIAMVPDWPPSGSRLKGPQTLHWARTHPESSVHHIAKYIFAVAKAWSEARKCSGIARGQL